MCSRLQKVSLQTSQGLQQRPDVSIDGIPFLTQFASGHYQHIEVDSQDVRVGSSALYLSDLDIDAAFGERSVNEGFSGGEKKRHEILQLGLLKPKIAILDETDSGLDVDALRVVSEGVNKVRGTGIGTLLITHYTRILRYIAPDQVHVFFDGRIVESGGPELAEQLESEGYARFGVEETASA